MGREIVTLPFDCGRRAYTYLEGESDFSQRSTFQGSSCPKCLAVEIAAYRSARMVYHEIRALQERARKLAVKRHLNKWLTRYRNCHTIKAAWQKFADCGGEVSLSRFYKDVKYRGGLIEALTCRFEFDVRNYWNRLGIDDEEIETLVALANSMFNSQLAEDLGCLR